MRAKSILNVAPAYCLCCGLIAADLIPALEVAVEGDTVDYSVTVCNPRGASGGFITGLFFDRVDPPSCGDPADTELSFTNIWWGSCQTKTHRRQGVPTGSMTAWAFADSPCLLDEKDEENNAATASYDVGPNIYVYNQTVNVNGNDVTYGIEICAWDASLDSGPFSVGLWYDLDLPPGCGAAGADQLWSGVQLPLGSCQTLTHSRSGAPPGDYTAHFLGDPDCTLAESREDDNRRARAYSVGAAQLPDLYLADLQAAVTGDSVVYRADVCNQGAGAAAPSTVALFFDRASAPDCSSPGDHSWAVKALDAGTCEHLTTTRNGALPGTHRGWFLADAACQQAEEEEGNNSSSVTYTVGQPDLVADSFSASVNDGDVTFNARVCNVGVAVTTSFAVGIYFNQHSAADCSQAPDHTEVLSSLAAGSCVQVAATQQAAGPGDKTARIFVDHLCQLDEGDEANNQLAHAYAVGSQQADLRLTSLEVQLAGDEVSFRATVCNNGSRPAPASALGLYYNRDDEPKCGEDPDWRSLLPELAAGDCATRSHTLQGVSGGTYRAWAVADVACQAGESDEDNNATSQTYQVEAKVMDLKVTSLTPSGAGEQLIFVATVCNIGNRSTPETATGIYWSRNEAPRSYCNEIPDQQATLSPLDPGQCVNQSWVLSVPPAGEHEAWVVADVACTLMEPDEANNLASSRYGRASDQDADAGRDLGALGDSGGDPSAGEGNSPGGGCRCEGGQARNGQGAFWLGGLLLVLLGRLVPRRRRAP